MRKLLPLTVMLILLVNICKAQFVDIPDPWFRSQLMGKYPACFNTLQQLDTTCSEILAEDSLQTWYEISSFDGLQYFKNLVHFECRNGGYTNTTFSSFPASLQSIQLNGLYNLATLPTLPPGLQQLIINNNDGLQNLPLLPAGLKILNCNQCHGLLNLPALPAGLNTLDFSGCWQINPPTSFPNSIEYLSFTESNVTVVPALPAALKTLYCGANPFQVLPALPPLLDKLYISGGRVLTALPDLPASLTYLDCGVNNLTTLPALPAALKYLNCRDNPLTGLPALPNGMTELFCSNISGFTPSLLVALPSLPNSLKRLSCSGHKITVLPTLPPLLEYLDCGMNLLISLPALPAQLKTLSAYNNKLTALPVLNDSLETLECASNLLTQLPALPDSLRSLHCGNNQLLNLPAVLPEGLGVLECSDNRLTSLPELPGTLSRLYCVHNDIYCLPKIPAFIYSPGIQDTMLVISFDADKINCIPNYTANLRLELNNNNYIPLCNPTNNIHQCNANPVMHGTVFFDNNNNGIKDIGEPVKKHAPVQLSDGTFTFTDDNGNYELGADALGDYSITVMPPVYFNVNPAALNYHFTSYDTLVTDLVALQANSTVDLVLGSVMAPWRAKPGFFFGYQVGYENAGATTISPNIKFDYDNTRLIFDSCSNASVVNTGSSLTLSAGSLPPGSQESFIAYFTVKPTAVINDSILSTLTTQANANVYTTSDMVGITGSFDPNDKQATPQLTPSQVAAGKYIDYTIRFQNTGTDTAFNIVISDTLSEDLQVTSLQVITSSHNCKTSVKGNIVFFEFINVMLPDSNISESKSHGFVSFKIKPRSSVSVNSTIENKAAIYFDYNAPVITNIAGTLIKDFTVLPLQLISFSAIPQTDNTTALYWASANEINTKHFVIEQSSNGSGFSALSTVLAKGRANNNYSAIIADAAYALFYFRLKIVDNDGSFTYSPVIKIDRRKNVAGFSILTNPVKDFITINTADASLNNTTCSIINTNGAVVKNFTIMQGGQTVDVKELPNGIYYLRTISGNSRFLKQ